jgi:CheY-like chemotaxis protein
MTKTVLIVEDNAIFRRGLERLVAAEGYESVAFGSGEEALEGLKAHEFDLALLDVRLPGMTGDTLGAILLKRCADKPIAFVTSDFSGENGLGFRLPGCRVILKPADVPSIIAFLHEVPADGAGAGKAYSRPS